MYISPGTTIFEIPENCEGIGQYYNIPVKFRDHSTKKVAQFFKLRMANLDHMFSDNRWTIHELVPQEPLDLLPDLDDDDDNVLKRLKKKMSSFDDLIEDVKTDRDWIWPVVIGLSCTVIIVLGVLAMYCSWVRTRGISVFRGAASDPEAPEVIVPMTAPESSEEPKANEEPLPSVGFIDIVAEPLEYIH